MFTNVTVTWFRSSAGDLSDSEKIQSVPQEYQLLTHRPTAQPPTTTIGNCSTSIYKDTFTLGIHNFTRDKSGYYWCHLAINNSYVVQRSHHARFFADSTNPAVCYSSPVMRVEYFKEALPNETQCAQYPALSTSLPPLSLTPSKSNLFPTPIPAITEILTTTHGVDQHRLSNERVIIYAIGILSAFVLIFGALVIALLILYLCKFRKRKKSKSLLYQ